MAAITPQTDLYLLKTPLENDGRNTLTFANATAQANYFLSLPKLNDHGLSSTETNPDFSYQRKDGTIRFPAHIDSLYGYNYVMYKNENYSDKWFYAFITDMQYVNDNTTFITISTDVFQTWQFKLDYKASFIEREHVNDDTIGLHTIPENLETGEVVQNSSITIEPNKEVWTSGHASKITENYLITFQVTELLPGSYGSELANTYNRVYSGLKYFAVRNAADANAIINKYATEGKSDAIVAIFLAPKEFYDGALFSNIATGSGDTNILYPVSSYYPSDLLENPVTVTMPSALNGYTPKNNKLKCYPYNYVTVDNNAGTCLTYHYELFQDNLPTYDLGGSIGQGCSIKLTPISYKGSSSENFEEGMNAMKLPICAWVNDYYTNWLTQNAINIPLKIGGALAGAGLALGGAAASGGLGVAAAAGTVLTAAQQIGNVVSENYQASLTPAQAEGNANCSEVAFAWRKFFTVKCMSIKSEYAKMCDDFFSMYGYKVNIVKTPNITGRQNWNYVKTIGLNVEGDVPETDMDAIRTLFNNGITLWHNPATYLDYSQNNAII